MKGFIMAAGLGTRLRPLSEKIAKPALPVAGVPTFWFGAWHLAKSLGITEIAINCGHAPETLRQAIDDAELSAMTGIQFHVSDESGGILGSSGGLWNLRDWVGDSQLAVFNGDSICFPDWFKLRKWHQKSKGLMTLHLIKHTNSTESYTDVTLDDFGRVVGFGEKKNTGTMFSGAYIIDPQALKRLPEGVSQLMNTLLKPLSDERQLFGLLEERPWFDTGTMKTFLDANLNVPHAMTDARELISVKMREVQPGCWVPRTWPERVGLKLHGPCVLMGEHKGYDATREYGPRLVCLSPPEAGPGALANGICFEKQFYSL